MPISVNDLIRSLTYDPRALLSLPPSGSIESIPAYERTPGDKGVIICTNTNNKENATLEDIVILNPTGGVIFPGALVLANQSLAEGKPTPITLPRSPMTISIDLPGIQSRQTIEGTKTAQGATISNSDVQAGINTMLEEWNQRPNSQGYVNNARSQVSIQKAYSSEQIALALGFEAKWVRGDVSSQLKVSSNRQSSSTVAFYKQVYYNVTMDPPATPGSVFAPTVTGEDLKAIGVDNKNPPAYVRSVAYGRLVLITMTTNFSDTEANLEGALKVATAPGTTASGSIDSKYKQIIENSSFTVVTLGGNPNTAAATMRNLNGLDALGKLSQYIAEGAAYNRSNPGAPIAYTVAFLKDNQLATVASSIQYTKKECVIYPSAFVRIVHSGAYVARFSVTWKEADSNGLYTQSQSWNSGNQTAGYSQTVSLPGDAREIVIRGEASTGLVWNPWGEIGNISLPGPDNKTYTAVGTTLIGRQFNVS